MGKAAVGTWVGAGRAGRMLALSMAVLVVMVITLTTLLLTASPPVAPASSGGGESPPVMGVGGEHYGEGWNNYGHALD